MGSILSAISDDIDDYLWLCEHFGEKPECDGWGPDPYGKHAKRLEAWRDLERKLGFDGMRQQLAEEARVAEKLKRDAVIASRAFQPQ